jgi:TusA-related sulfurtransferase
VVIKREALSQNWEPSGSIKQVLSGFTVLSNVKIMTPSFKQPSNFQSRLELKTTLRPPPRITIDSRGIWCPPTPITDLFKAWRKANLGDVIELLATEPEVESDVRAWAKKSGNKVLEVVHGKGYTTVVVRITKRGKEVAEMSAVKADINDPDETKVTPKAKLQLITIGGFTLGLRTLEPGWRWSESMRPLAKTESCEIRHIGYVLSGRLGFMMNDGTKLEVGPGEAFDAHAGHDTWTIGLAPAVFLDLIGAVDRELEAASADGR